MNKIAAYYGLLEDHYLWNKEAMSSEERSAIIDDAKDRANAGTLSRALLGSTTGVPVGYLPVATMASGYGVKDSNLRDRIRERTMLSGTAGGVLGALPGAALMVRSRSIPELATGTGLAVLGSVGGELAGQRVGLNRLKAIED